MKEIMFAITLGMFLLMASCTMKKWSGSKSDQTSAEALCYYFANQRDTTTVRLFVNTNNQVSGDYTRFSPERMSSGILEGTLKGDTIRAHWVYQLAGIQTSEKLRFYFNKQTKELRQLGTYPEDSKPMRKVDCDQLPAFSPNELANETPQAHRVLCFLRLEGTKLQDTIALKLHILPDRRITADYVWLPKEKDAKVGTLSGQLRGDSIQATYTYLQEGKQHMETLRFYFQSDTGRLVLRGSVTDSIRMDRVHCEKMPWRLRKH